MRSSQWASLRPSLRKRKLSLPSPTVSPVMATTQPFKSYRGISISLVWSAVFDLAARVFSTLRFSLKLLKQRMHYFVSTQHDIGEYTEDTAEE